MKTLARFAMLSGAVCGLVLGTTLASHGQTVPDGNRNYVLQAHLTGKNNAEGKVHFRLKESYREFQLHIANAAAGEVLVIAVRRGNELFKFAWVRANRLGVAELFVSSDSTIPVPVLRKRDVIEIWHDKGMMLSGSMY